MKKTQEQIMELEGFYENDVRNNGTTGRQRHCRDEGQARNRKGSRCLVLTTVCLGILCLLLIPAIIYQHIKGASKKGYVWGPDGLFISIEQKSWSDSRQYCRDHGGDLVIIRTEEKQRHITSLVKDNVWIGLSDIENEGMWKWVDNSPLKQGFWDVGEPNNYHGDEDCIGLNPGIHTLNNWGDFVCSYKRKGLCEKRGL
ncbi:CD209 antigen-like protein 2 isoform X2 [Megalobrama amblycephala]|uniref:CD209 antigen-like protein 2 isoform X2 n=1 Tax=Megalobrama amblycephala TaxID=75352 RepID=UPI0020141A17|nr:CD209 antigen-like protein 2 isoform X2 [Megalobrama amblycephala]